MTDTEIQNLNKVYRPLPHIKRLERIFKEFDHRDILVTSSFGSTSGILMSMVAQVAPGHPIHFIDTTFCFSQTLEYKEALVRLLGLKIVNVIPNLEDNMFARQENLWIKDSDQCCNLNKVKPFEKYKEEKKIWISGLLMNQSPFRQNLEIFERRDQIIKMHPNIDRTEKEFEKYLVDNFIPIHPLKYAGYESVGCTHCTQKGKGRDGRWNGKPKTECGLHNS